MLLFVSKSLTQDHHPKGNIMRATKKSNRVTANLTKRDGRIAITVDPTENVGRTFTTGTAVDIDLGDGTRIYVLGQYLGDEKRFGSVVSIFDYRY
ncbi:hypothetical protein UFOVP1305_66 [uncultured Caudovirales phage]|uniref:Uncharacterized protein n=1 Tax=uncultured Caudovirales phage TaxID=2100421 RepID=A0A6J5PC08_9CAUD|nr:hypothetical protein UFOVP896_11 [uncultured Caudovirales phage]CAB4198294.1 hypothetical protein UFOVP1305_66 [uncultured Caudovirales phage]